MGGKITVSPVMVQAIMMAIQMAIMQLSQETKGMTEEELIFYIAGQETRKKKLLKAIDEV
jgi:hypothetical protein